MRKVALVLFITIFVFNAKAELCGGGDKYKRTIQFCENTSGTAWNSSKQSLYSEMCFFIADNFNMHPPATLAEAENICQSKGLYMAMSEQCKRVAWVYVNGM